MQKIMANVIKPGQVVYDLLRGGSVYPFFQSAIVCLEVVDNILIGIDHELGRSGLIKPDGVALLISSQGTGCEERLTCRAYLPGFGRPYILKQSIKAGPRQIACSGLAIG